MAPGSTDKLFITKDSSPESTTLLPGLIKTDINHYSSRPLSPSPSPNRQVLRTCPVWCSPSSR